MTPINAQPQAGAGTASRDKPAVGETPTGSPLVSLPDGGAPIIDWLMFRAYSWQRSYGLTQAQLVSIGFDPRFEALYAEAFAKSA
jgi:hypothetical protein